MGTALNNSVRVGNTVVVSSADGLRTLKAYVSAAVAGTQLFTLLPYTQALFTSNAAGDVTFGNEAVNLFVYGSEFAKGTTGMVGSLEASFTQYSNKPIIIKDTYEVTGSDAAQIGWVEVATEDGTSGYLWYLKSEGETRLRFQDYLEMAVVEGETATAASGVIVNTALGTGITKLCKWNWYSWCWS